MKVFKNIVILIFIFCGNLNSQNTSPEFITFKINNWYTFSVLDTVEGKLKHIGDLKYDLLYNNLLLYYPNNKPDTIRKIKNPFSLNELLFEVKSKNNGYIEIYIDSLKQRKLIIFKDKKIKYYSAKQLFLKNTFFVYTKDIHSHVIYKSPNLNSEKYIDTIRFNCFTVKDVKNEWVKVATTIGDPCGNSEEGRINVGWIKWYDKNKLLLDIQSK